MADRITRTKNLSETHPTEKDGRTGDLQNGKSLHVEDNSGYNKIRLSTLTTVTTGTPELPSIVIKEDLRSNSVLTEWSSSWE